MTERIMKNERKKYVNNKQASDYNWTQIQNHLVLKQTLNHLASWPNG